jgi:hypothetical protein
MLRHRRGPATLIVLALIACSPATQFEAQPAVWFRASFEALNERGANLYNFANRFAQSDTTWRTEHLPTGGWKGSGAPHVRVFGCQGADCNTSTHQMNVGWQTPGIGTPLGRAWQIGDQAFIRFRIKFDPDTTFPIERFGAKFILWGQTRTTPNSRWIIHLFPALENAGCTLGFPSYSHMGWTPPSSVWNAREHWGLKANFDEGAVAGLYAGFTSHVNISWSCMPAILVTRSNHPAPVPKPQRHGAAPVDGWYHLQFQAVSGADGAADFRAWANNNEERTPSSEHLNMAEGLGVSGWDQGVYVAGYWGTSYPGEIGFVIDDFEIGASFDPAWYPVPAKAAQESAAPAKPGVAPNQD